jgi:predicted secreted protein
MGRRLAFSLGLLALLAIGLSGCLSAPVTITSQDDGSIVAARVGDRINVRLDGNPSTGYTWSRTEPVDLTDSPLEPIEEGNYVDSGGTWVGAPAFAVFRYAAVAAGTVQLTYAYHAAWEEVPVQTFSVVVWVRNR